CPVRNSSSCARSSRSSSRASPAIRASSADFQTVAGEAGNLVLQGWRSAIQCSARSPLEICQNPSRAGVAELADASDFSTTSTRSSPLRLGLFETRRRVLQLVLVLQHVGD